MRVLSTAVAGALVALTLGTFAQASERQSVSVIGTFAPLTTDPTPSPEPEPRHRSGLLLLSPPDLRALGPMYEPLAKAVSDADLLARDHPDLFGYPWADRASGQVVVSVVNAEGDAMARRWIAEGLHTSGPYTGLKGGRDLPAPEVPARIRVVDRTVAQLDAIMHGAIGRETGFSDSDLVWMTGPDSEHNRIVIGVDHVSDALLDALAARYGTEAIAIQVERNPGFVNLAGATWDERPWGGAATVAGMALLAGGVLVVLRRLRRRSLK